MLGLGVVIATVAGLVTGAIVYGAMPAAPPTTSPAAPSRPAAAVAVVELLRSAAVAGLLAGLLAAGDWSGWAAGAPSRAALHALDWAIKLAAIGAILGVFA
jgi:hypothetical protein